jgi:hypothetical protein
LILTEGDIRTIAQRVVEKMVRDHPAEAAVLASLVVQSKLHTALNEPVWSHACDDDLGPADAVDGALPLADEAPLLRQAYARQEQGRDGKDDPSWQHVLPEFASFNRLPKTGISPVPSEAGLSLHPQRCPLLGHRVI